MLLHQAPQGQCLHGRSRAMSIFRGSHQIARAATTGLPTACLGIPPELLAQGGVDPSTQPEESRLGYASFLKTQYLPVHTLQPGLRLLSLDPPVIAIDEFATPEMCQALREAAGSSGLMSVSRVGGGDANAPVNIRTSRTLVMTKEVLDKVPSLKSSLDQLLEKAEALFQGASFKKALFSKPTHPGQLVPELPQIAHYDPGQHFLAHEDAFPAQIALQKGFQRRATLLVYLNDVPEGGSTRFERLGFEVQPKQGKALLFFPAFSGGMPDARTLHTAVDAVSEKWIFQLWLTSGLPAPKAPTQVQVAQSTGRGASKGKAKGKRK